MMGLRIMLSLVAFCVSSLVLGQDILNGGLSSESLSSESDPDPESLRAKTSTACTLARILPPNSFNSPLLSNSTGRIYPGYDNGGDILIASGTRFNASCAPPSALLKVYKVNQVGVECRSGILSTYPDGAPTNFSMLGCQEGLKEDVDELTNGLCGDNTSQNISIGFTTSLRRFPLITVCHDYDLLNTRVSKHTIYGASLRSGVAEVSNARPSFKKANFFSTVSPSDAYSQNSQRKMIQSLVGSSALANEYINVSQSFYFARGHLAPDGDFVYISEQNATYYFINVMPQWQSINNGNWKAMEVAVRNLAVAHQSQLTIYTGTIGVLKLNDVNNNPVEIYLAKNPQSNQLVIPVPRLVWKLVHEPKTKSAVVIIMVNNPHIPDGSQVASEDKICTDICDKISFVPSITSRSNTRKGYTYCCDYADFKKGVMLSNEGYVPSIVSGRTTLKLLTS